MTTYAPQAHLHRPHVDRWLLTVVVLAAGLVGLGAWVIVDHTGGGGSSATKDATTLIDRFNTAGNAGDKAALKDLVANNFVMRSEGNVITGGAALAESARLASLSGLKIERIAPVTVNGDFATTFVRATAGGSSRVVLSVTQIKDGKVVRLWGFDLGTTPPFDNAVPK